MKTKEKCTTKPQTNANAFDSELQTINFHRAQSKFYTNCQFIVDFDFRKAMDLKQQLVIWKRAGFLLDNVALSPTLLDNLLAGDVITPVMAGEIQVGQET